MSHDQGTFQGDTGNGEPAIPPRLAERLRELERVGTAGAGVVGGGLDDLVGRMAASEFARRSRRRVVFRTASGLAAAAGLALAVWVVWPGLRGAGTGSTLVAGLDPQKRVDILDAFKLARLLRERHGTATSGTVIPASWDVTGDGAVDQADVDRLGAMAVRLSGKVGVGEGGAS